ncbi:DNA-primase RepB domain-containing protein [Burkholderia sp. WSM2230]|uniref:DNA-primase RepB domain-containing protein n=1 Tax=Burkholderia sp. WSM2230 TaxID=944435 RepID=UPI0004279CE4|nr:DNA-primase RepB domain-containing protein [Burkholderia sp. WSM2230]
MSLIINPFDINSLTLAQRRAMAEGFAAELGAGLDERDRVLVCQKPDAMIGGFWMRSFQPDTTQLDVNKNIYTCIAAVNPVMKAGERVWERKAINFRCGLALCLDDIGSGKGSKGAMAVDDLAARLAPTAVVETSGGNFQVWYFLDKPEYDRAKFKNFLVSFIDQVVKGKGGDKLDDPVRVMRLPFGINNKRTDDGELKYADESGNPFEVRLSSADYDRRYSIEQICEAFGVEIVESRKYEATGERKGRGDDPYHDALFEAAVEVHRVADALHEEGEDKYVIPCPWGAEHSSGDNRAFISGPRAEGMDRPYTFHCYHSSCQEKGRTWRKFVEELGLVDTVEKAIDAAANELARISAEAAASDAEWREVLFGVADADAPTVQAEKPLETADPAGAMKSSSDERAKLEAKARADLGVGPANWHRGWCFSIQEGKACRPGNSFMYDQSAFNAVFGKNHFSISSEEKLGTKTAWQYVQNTVGFKSVAATAYVMGKGPVFEFDGKVYVNLFDERSVPQTADELTWEGLAARLTVQYHLRTLFGSDASAERIESWIAMNVKRPGELIGFAPLIKGIEGDGKTIVFQGLMGALLGDANVGQVSGDQLAEKYTGWAKGKALMAIEEIKAASGENRHHATNKMKPYITNKKIEIDDKNVKRHETMNATNYVGMTNFANALPIKDGDRRWMVEFTQWNNIGQFIEKEGVADAPQDQVLVPYFARVLWAIREEGPQLRKFFMEYELKQGMKWGVRAPDTESKRLMVGIENSDSGLDKIKSYLEDGALGVSDEIVSTSMLNDHIARDTGEKRLMTRQIAMMMLDIGFTKVPWDLKWEGKAHTIYVRDVKTFDIGKDGRGKTLANERLRKLLDATKTETNAKEYVPRVVDRNGF